VTSTSSQCTFSALTFSCCFNEIEPSTSYVSYDVFKNSSSSKDKTNHLSNDNSFNDDIDYYDVNNIYDIDNNDYEMNEILNDHSENDKMEINKKSRIFDEMSLIFISIIKPTPISISIRQSIFENCFIKLKNYSEYDSCLFPIHSHSIYIQGRNCTYLSSPSFSSFYCYSSSNSVSQFFSSIFFLSDLLFKRCCNVNGSVMLFNNINGIYIYLFCFKTIISFLGNLLNVSVYSNYTWNATNEDSDSSLFVHDNGSEDVLIYTLLKVFDCIIVMNKSNFIGFRSFFIYLFIFFFIIFF
jgi:hypothetical protein